MAACRQGNVPKPNCVSPETVITHCRGHRTMKRQFRLKIILLSCFLLINVACTPPIILSIRCHPYPENERDSIFVYTDAPLTMYNADKKFEFIPELQLYKYTIINDDNGSSLVILRQFVQKCYYPLERCKDTVKKLLPISYLKFVGKGCNNKIYIHEAKGKNEILDFFKQGSNGQIEFNPCDLK